MNRRARSSNTARLGWLFLAALPLLVGAGGTTTGELSEHQLEEELLVGIFEGHGVAPPSDPAKAEEARRIAQRLGQRCFSRGITRGGGSEEYAGTCGISSEVPADAAAALLDELSDPRVALPEGRSLGAWDRLLGALASTGRTDVVPALVTALARIELRERAPGRLREESGAYQNGAVELTLQKLTYVDSGMAFVSEATAKLSTAEAWKAWLEAHGGETRAQWKAQAIERARHDAQSDDASQRHRGARALLDFHETRTEGVRAARALMRDEPERAGDIEDMLRSRPRK